MKMKKKKNLEKLYNKTYKGKFVRQIIVIFETIDCETELVDIQIIHYMQVFTKGIVLLTI
jgi:hypothetical protein